MKALWAPWRGQYLQETVRQPGNSCFLCRGLAGDQEREDLLVWRGSHAAVFLNRYPYSNGHLLVCPIEHVGTLGELAGPSLVEPVEVIRRMTGSWAG